MTDLNEAIAIVKAAGYSIIRRERIVDLHAREEVQNAAILQYRTDSHFPSIIGDQLRRSLAGALGGKGILHFDSTRSDFTTEFRASLKVIPFDQETDPFLELMRQGDRTR